MNTYLASFGPALANHLWQSTAFAAAAWLLTILLRKNSAPVRYGLWLAASIKFLLPFSLLIALGGLLPKPTKIVAPAVYTAMQVTEQPFADVSSTFVTPVLQPTRTRRIAAHLPSALFVLWLIGAAAALIVWWVRWRRASVCLHEAVAAGNGRELEILRRLEARISGRPHSPLRLKLSAEQTEPSIYGIFRPVLVWPRQLSQRLSDEHIEAIMAHELAHARRFDNAAAALHMFVEAVFWFHPLVWWMERRMIEERERACDETVVSIGGKPEAYAEGILETCRFCVGSALPCVAGVTGADLRDRVVGIMTSRTLMRITWPKKMLLGVLALCALTAPVLLGQLDTSTDWEEAAGGKISFEAASLKPSAPGSEGIPSNFLYGSDPEKIPNGLLTGRNIALFMYIAFAYKLDRIQSIAPMPTLPSWARQARFDIDARPPGRDVTRDQVRLMMQSLLADRFRLAVHFDTKPGSAYALVLAKPGKPASQVRTYPDGFRCADGDVQWSVNGGPTVDNGQLPVYCGEILPMKPSGLAFGAWLDEMSRWMR